MKTFGEQVFFDEDERAAAAQPVIRVANALFVADIWARRAESCQDMAIHLAGAQSLEQRRSAGLYFHESYLLKQMSKRLL